MKQVSMTIDFPIYSVGEYIIHQGYFGRVVKYIYPTFENGVLSRARIEALMGKGEIRWYLNAEDVEPYIPSYPPESLVINNSPPNNELFQCDETDYIVLEIDNSFWLYRYKLGNMELLKRIDGDKTRDKIFNHFSDELKLKLRYQNKPVFMPKLP